MKKILCLLMSLMLLACGCAWAETSAPDVTGVWYGDLFGIVCTMTVNEDGTYQVEFAEDKSIEPQQGVWKQNGTELILDEGTDNELVLTTPTDMLVLSHGGLTFFFTREIPTEFVPAAINENVSLEQFFGQWSMTHLTSMGLLFDGNTLGIQISMNISGSDTLVFLSPTALDGQLIVDPEKAASPSFDPLTQTYTAEMSGTFEGGVLKLTEILPDPAPADEAENESEQSAIPMLWEVRLLQDGNMCITDVTVPEYPVEIYMTPLMPLMIAE